jgi:hypothetical protein
MQRVIFDDLDDGAALTAQMDLTATVGSVLAQRRSGDDTNMQLTGVVQPKQQQSLLSIVEQLRDDAALYDAPTDSEEEDDDGGIASLLAPTATMQYGAQGDDQTRDMDETAALAETRIVVKLPGQREPSSSSPPFIADDDDDDASANINNATMDLTEMVGGARGRSTDTTMDFTAIVAPRHTQAVDNGLAALLARTGDDETRNFGAEGDDATGNVAPSLNQLLELYRRADASRRQSLCAELCDAVGVDRTCETQIMQVMEDLGDAATDRVVAVGDETAALVNTGRFGNTVRFAADAAAAAGGLTQELTNGFTTILSRLREMRERYDTEDFTKTRELTGAAASTGAIGAMTMMLAEETRDDIVLRTGAGRERSPSPSLSVASTPNRSFMIGAADDGDDLLSAVADTTTQSIGDLVDVAMDTALLTAVVAPQQQEPAVVPAVAADEQEEQDEVDDAVVAESEALQTVKQAAAQHGWRLLGATGIDRFVLARTGAALRVTLGVALIDDKRAMAGEVSVRAANAADSDAQLLCDWWLWQEAQAAPSSAFEARFSQLSSRMRAVDALFRDVRAARRKANINVVKSDAPDGTVRLSLRVSSAAQRQQWHVAVQLADVQLYPSAAHVAVCAELLFGDASDGGAASAALVKHLSGGAPTIASIVHATNEHLLSGKN